MVYVWVRHDVEDYGKWKPVFDEHAALREQYGSTGGWVFRSQENPNNISVLLEYEDEGKAHEFAESQDLKDAMAKAGVVGEPEVLFLDELAEAPA